MGGYDYFVSLVVCVLDPFYGVGEFGGCGDFSEGGELDEGFVVLCGVVCSDGGGAWVVVRVVLVVVCTSLGGRLGRGCILFGVWVPFGL